MERIGNLPAAGEPGLGPEPFEEPAYVLVEPMRRSTGLVFASPHSGRRYPPGFLAQSTASLSSLRQAEDSYVDELFAGAAAAAGAPLLCATMARAYLDLNRDETDLDPDMFFDPPEVCRPLSPRTRAGLGVAPRIAGDGTPIYSGRIAFAEIERRIARVHRPYHQTLAGLLQEARQAFGVAGLIDCHSMPSGARGPASPDIVLGDRYGASCRSEMTALAERTLRRMGYRVTRNAPFAGGHTTQRHGRPADGVHALQIELNRGLYMNERTFERGGDFERVRADMRALGEALAQAFLPAAFA